MNEVAMQPLEISLMSLKLPYLPSRFVCLFFLTCGHCCENTIKKHDKEGPDFYLHKFLLKYLNTCVIKSNSI